MARKKKFSYKNLKVDESDLAVTKIGEMPNENKSPIFVILVFGILIAFIIFLPDIVSYLSEGNIPFINGPSVIEEENTPEDVNEKELIYYNLDSSSFIQLEEGINISNLEVENNKLSFVISNNNESKFYFSKRNYFIELYSEDKTLLERIILTKDSISNDSSKDYNYSILSNTAINAKMIVFVEKQVEDYPLVTLSTNEEREEVLTCIREDETITYKFKEEKLEVILDVLNYIRSDNDIEYLNDVMNWQNRVSSYNNINGITSSFISNDNGFVVNTMLNLANVKTSAIDNDYYYEYKTPAKVVNFEMEARGFSCN